MAWRVIVEFSSFTMRSQHFDTFEEAHEFLASDEVAPGWNDATVEKVKPVCMSAAVALDWLTEETPDKCLMWCEAHEETVWMYGDGSWLCTWQLIVETGDEGHCRLVSQIPKKYTT